MHMTAPSKNGLEVRRRFPGVLQEKLQGRRTSPDDSSVEYTEE